MCWAYCFHASLTPPLPRKIGPTGRGQPLKHLLGGMGQWMLQLGGCRPLHFSFSLINFNFRKPDSSAMMVLL